MRPGHSLSGWGRIFVVLIFKIKSKFIKVTNSLFQFRNGSIKEFMNLLMQI